MSGMRADYVINNGLMGGGLGYIISRPILEIHAKINKY